MTGEAAGEDPAVLLRRLGDAMSDLSERCYYAGWMTGTEYVVPELCRRAAATGEPQPWGQDEVTAVEAAELLSLALRLGTWADLDEAGTGYVPFQPFPVPAKYQEEIEREIAWRLARRPVEE